MIVQNLLSNKNNILLNAFFLFLSKEGLHLHVFPLKGKISAGTFVTTRRRERGMLKKTKNNLRLLVGLFFESWSEIPRYQLSTSTLNETRSFEWSPPRQCKVHCHRLRLTPPPLLNLPNPSKQPLDRCRVSCYVDGGCGGFPRRKPMNDLSVFIKLCRVLEMSVETSWGCTTVRRIAYASEDDGSQEGVGLSG